VSARRQPVPPAPLSGPPPQPPVGDADISDIGILVRVLDAGGLAPAARALGVPTSTLSRAIGRLEESLGVRLLHRTPRGVAATPEGERLHAEAAPAVRALVDATRHVVEAGKTPRGRLRVTAPNDLGISFVAGAAVTFTARYPEVSVELELTGRAVDLVGEGFDIAVRAGVLPDSALVSRRIGDLEEQMFASPAYLERRGPPATLADLAAHDAVLFRPRNGEAVWSLSGPEGEIAVRVRGRVGGDDYGFVRAAVLSGGGVALLPRIVCGDDLFGGRLVRVLPQYQQRQSGLFLVHTYARHVPAKIAAFRDHLVETYGRTCGEAVKRLDGAAAAATRGSARRRAGS
jgi:DNA-binding transcriptional LysR family regulator